MRNSLLLGLLILLTLGGTAQDVHFTQFVYAPQSYNPGLIGGYAGTYRASGILRDQDKFFKNGFVGYQTVEANVDAPIIRGLRNQDWIGVGVSFNSDVRGSLNLSTSLTRLGAAYHIGLDKKSNSYVSIGAQWATSSTKLENNPNILTPGKIVAPGANDPDINQAFNSNEIGSSGGDVVLGLAYTGKSKQGSFKIGVSGSQFLTNNVGFRQAVEDPLKLIGFFQMYRIINKKLSIEPAVLFQTIAKDVGFEITAHNMFSYKLKEDNDLRLKGGLGFRTGSFAPQILVGAGYKGFSGGLSFDLPVNGVQNARGGQYALELAVGYIGIINKTPKPEPIILCPRL